MRLFLQPPTTTQMISDVVVYQLVLFTKLQSFFRNHEEKSDPTPYFHLLCFPILQ